MNKLLVLLLFAASAAAAELPAPKSIPELRNLSAHTELTFVADIDGGDGFSAALYSYKSAGLTIHTMVATPDALPPEGGFPVLVFNHGFHPDPPTYGYTKDGRDSRPGDYYRQIPALYVKHGLLVVIPDYRGHSNSEGVEFTQSLIDASYYTEDVVTLISGLDSIPFANTDRLFMMGHSMGGDVTFRTLVSSGRILAASLWSTVGGDLWDQAYYYSRYEDPFANDSSTKEKDVVLQLRRSIASFSGPFDPESVDPLRFVDGLDTPVILHHSIGDKSTAFRWSVEIAQTLYLKGKTYQLFSYAGDAHLFGDDDLELAAQRDVAFFQLFDPASQKVVPDSQP